MFCPKCGIKNPDAGKFCRKCGTDLSSVSQALSGKLRITESAVPTNRRGRKISWESALGKLFTGIAFVAVTVALANSVVGTGWWFWMLIPALSMIGAGLAQIIQIRRFENSNPMITSVFEENELSGGNPSELPSGNPDYISPVENSKYITGDLAPPGVTEGTTRHLELDSENETMTLPEQNH